MDNLKGKTVSLAHGAGGKQTSELIDQVFKAHSIFPAPLLLRKVSRWRN